ncbi:ABC transporter ATP-binding protein [Roseomonas sp. 18066]|uniref:ABC transporter ATP-binding protein n=1 Tax=Roseomonas sp. 18066 TaxID=2681412 RepID=UPI0013596BD7|nr:ABC transporter ATP-binding protein [Roseomonas sp. 18066]
MLNVRGLTKVYANKGDGPSGGVQEASFDLQPATFFTLLGPSGCGKTTTLRCIAGLETPDAGSIRVADTTFFDSAQGVSVPMNLRRIGMVFQSYAIWPHMTVFENVAFPLRVTKGEKLTGAEIGRRVEEALERVSLQGFGGRSATRLSGGQQQRVALARAIVLRPRLLLLDEPLSNLDAALRDEMRNELRRLQQQIGITTVYVTHDQTEALEMSDQIAVMERGRIVQIGAPRDIYFRPANAFVAGFVGTTNWLDGAMGEACGPGIRQFRLGDGRSLQCILGNQQTTGGARISVRPEKVVLRRDGAPAAAAHNRLDGTVVFAGFLGTMNRYQVDIGGSTMQVYDAADAAFTVGERVALDFPVADTVALDG